MGSQVLSFSLAIDMQEGIDITSLIIELTILAHAWVVGAFIENTKQLSWKTSISLKLIMGTNLNLQGMTLANLLQKIGWLETKIHPRVTHPSFLNVT